MSRRFPNERVESAQADFREARARAVAAVEAEYPVETSVIVHHYRGQFRAKIAVICGRYGYDIGYVYVRNDHTGKTSKRYYAELERV